MAHLVHPVLVVIGITIRQYLEHII
jgi:hypothetical protein